MTVASFGEFRFFKAALERYVMLVDKGLIVLKNFNDLFLNDSGPRKPRITADTPSENSLGLGEVRNLGFI